MFPGVHRKDVIILAAIFSNSQASVSATPSSFTKNYLFFKIPNALKTNSHARTEINAYAGVNFAMRLVVAGIACV